MRMRIAFAGVRGVPALYSGFETAVTEIGTRLVKRGHEIVVYCRNGYGDESEPEYQGIKKIYLPRLEFKVADTLSHTFFAFIHAFFHPPDIILVMNSANGPLSVVPWLRGTPFAINVDGLEWERGKWPWIGRKYFYFASWFSTKIANAIIADSRALADYYRTHWNSESFYASYGATVESDSKTDHIESLGLRSREYFLVCARLVTENNVHVVVDAFAKVKTDKRLVIVGGTNFKSAYVDKLTSSTTDPRVLFVGSDYNQAHLTQLMCHSFAYIHGHMVGGTNPVLLKAMGCGACVLYADVVFNEEVVRDAGSPFPLDSDGAARVFQEFVDHPERAENFRKIGPERIRQAYTWELATDRYEQLCDALYNRKRAYDLPEQSGSTD